MGEHLIGLSLDTTKATEFATKNMFAKRYSKTEATKRGNNGAFSSGNLAGARRCSPSSRDMAATRRQ